MDACDCGDLEIECADAQAQLPKTFERGGRS
jgi:hypothetical protein